MKCFLCGHTPITPPDMQLLYACPCCQAPFLKEESSIKISSAGSRDDDNNFSISFHSSQANAVPKKEIAVRVNGPLVLNVTRYGQKMRLVLDETGLAQVALYCQSSLVAAQDDEQRPRTYQAELGGHEKKVRASMTEWVLQMMESTNVR